MTNVMAFPEKKTPMDVTMYLAEKELVFTRLLKERTDKFKGFILSRLNKKDPNDADEIFQSVSVGLWAKYSERGCDWDYETLAKLFTGYMKNACANRNTRGRRMEFAFSSFGTSDDGTYAENIADYDDKEDLSEQDLMSGFLAESLQSLDTSDRSFIECYLRNGCSMVRTIHELGKSEWWGLQQFRLVVARIRSKVTDPILIEIMREGNLAGNKPPASPCLALAGLRYDLALGKALDNICRGIAKDAAGIYRYHVDAFVKAIDMVADPLYALSDLTPGIYAGALGQLSAKHSHESFKRICQVVRQAYAWLVKKGALPSNIFWESFCHHQGRPVLERKGMEEIIFIVRGWVTEGCGRKEIQARAAGIWGTGYNKVTGDAIKIVEAEGIGGEGLKTQAETVQERVAVVADWLASPTFKVKERDLATFTAEYFKVSRTAATKYVRDAREKNGMAHKGMDEVRAARMAFITAAAADQSMTLRKMLRLVMAEYGISVPSASALVQKFEAAGGRKLQRSDSGAAETERRVALACGMLADPSCDRSVLRRQLAESMNVSESRAKAYIQMAVKRIKAA